MRFTREDFDTMVQEVLYTKPGRKDALCRIVELTIGPLVRTWCQREDVLRNRGLEGDLLHDILLHVMQRVVHGFLRNDRTTGDYNDDPEGFEHWLMRVANNYKRDFVNKLRREEFRTVGEESLERMSVPEEDPTKRQEYLQQVQEAFDVVLSADVRVYKVLTWLAQILFVVEGGLAHHEANAKVVTTFENMTLNQMYGHICAAARRVEWMVITPEQHARIMAALQKPWENGLTYGEATYQMFFQKTDGEPNGKKSVSDWMNRMTERIKKKVKRGADEPRNNSAPTPRGAQRRDEDGSSCIG